MNSLALIRAIFSGILLISTAQASAAIVASSSFDSGSDGWTWTVANDSAFSWQSSGGNPGGYVHYNDNLHTNVDVAWLNAPSEYLGDWSSLGITQLSFDFNIFQLGNVGGASNYSVSISGPGGDALWLLSPLDVATPWKSITAPINQADWTINSGTWNGILADVDMLSIALEVATTSGPHEITGIDNVSLSSVAASVPVPAVAWLFGPGLFALLGIARRKKSG